MKLLNILLIMLVCSCTAKGAGPTEYANFPSVIPPFSMKNNTCHGLAVKVRSNDGSKTLAFTTIAPGATIQFPSWPQRYYGSEGLRVRFYYWPQIAPNNNNFSYRTQKTTDPDNIQVIFTPYEPPIIAKHYLYPNGNVIAIEYDTRGNLGQKTITAEEVSQYIQLP